MFSQTLRFLSAVVAVFALLAGCAPSDPKSPGYVVVKGKGVRITRGELDQAAAPILSQRGLSRDQLPSEQRAFLDRQVAERLAMDALVLNDSKTAKLPELDARADEEFKKIQERFATPEAFQAEMTRAGVTVEKLKADIARTLRIHETLKAKVPAPAEPAPEAVGRFYEENKDRFQHPAQVRVSHILARVPPEADAAAKAQKKKRIENARARVVKGEDFSVVAREMSDDTGSAAQGGDLNFFSQNQMVPAFSEVAFKSKPGAVSPVFQTPFGYHILKVTGARPAGADSLEHAKPMIVAFLQNQERQKSLEAYIQGLRAKANLKFNLPEAPAAPREPAPNAPPPPPAPPPAPRK